MLMPAYIEIAVFAVFGLIAVAGALGMTTTMSMFRSAIFLMASFVGVAGLFILLMADLLGMLQVMMYVGGMLVMALFMVLFSGDPGGEMMASMMRMPLVERAFSQGLLREDMRGDHGGAHGDDHRGDHGDMSMFTPIKKHAAVIGALAGGSMLALVLLRRPWPVVDQVPDQDSAARIGHELMGTYMIAFEGAGLLILLGIFGAVWTARPGRHPDPVDRQRLQAAVDEPPAPIEADEESA